MHRSYAGGELRRLRPEPRGKLGSVTGARRANNERSALVEHEVQVWCTGVQAGRLVEWLRDEAGQPLLHVLDEA